MSFKAVAEIKVNPDGTITGKLIGPSEMKGLGLVTKGSSQIGWDTWENKIAIKFRGESSEQ